MAEGIAPKARITTPEHLLGGVNPLGSGGNGPFVGPILLDSGPKRKSKLNHLRLPGEDRVLSCSAKLLCYQFKRNAFQ